MNIEIWLEPDTQLDPDKQYLSVKSYEVLTGKPDRGARHGNVCERLAHKLRVFVATRGLGKIHRETRFQIGCKKCSPDLAFVSASRIPPEGLPKSNGQYRPI